MSDSTGIGAVDAAVVWAIAIVAILGLLGALWRLVRPLRRIVQLVDMFWEDWQGTPGRPGVPPRPGVMARLDRIEDRVGIVVHEVRPNGGGSMRDAIDRVDARTAPPPGDEP